MSIQQIRLPAEWELQSALLLTWPHEETDWLPQLEQVEQVFLDIVSIVAPLQPVIISCHHQAHKFHVEKILCNKGIPVKNIRLFIAPSNDSWVRDHGPITVFENNSPILLDFDFNGWGNKFPSQLDNAITCRLAKSNAFCNTPVKTKPIILEGGSIDTDGCGTLLTTRSCLLSSGRNPDCDINEIESKLKTELGINRIIWFTGGSLCGDDTDGHIDMLVRFIDKNTLVYATSDDSEDENYTLLKCLEQEISRLNKSDGSSYRIVGLPVPKILNSHGKQYPASYMNFVFCNDMLLVPLYGHDLDAYVINTLSSLVQDRKTVGIDCMSLIQQNGSLHCITMHLPAGVIK